MKMVKILGICGSLRKGSYNRMLLEAAQDFTPQDSELILFSDLAAIPLFNQDQEKNPPAAVTTLKEKIMDVDAILFATPEYNYSIPGVLKNAIDWASRPYGENSWDDKPVGIMSASGGMLGGARAQYQLRQVFVFLNMHPLNKPEVIIPEVQNKLDDHGKITDQHTAEKITELLQALVTWTRELHAGERAVEEEAEKQDYESAYRRFQN